MRPSPPRGCRGLRPDGPQPTIAVLREGAEPRCRRFTLWNDGQPSSEDPDHAPASPCLSSRRHGLPRRGDLRASARLDGGRAHAARGRQCGGRRRGGGCRAQRGGALHVQRRRHRAHADLARAHPRAPRARLHRPRAPGGRSRPSHRGRAGGRAQGLRHAGQSRGLAGRPGALRQHAARARAGSRHRVRRERRAPDVDEHHLLREVPRDARPLDGGAAALSRQWVAAARQDRDLQGARRHVPTGGGGRRGGLLQGAHRESDRPRGTRGRGLAHRGRPGRLHPGVAPAGDHHLPRPRGVLGAAALLRLPDARDPEHHGGLRRGALGAQFPRAPAPSHRGDQDRLGGPPRLCLSQRRLEDSHQRARVQGLCRLAAGAHRSRPRGGERGRAAHAQAAHRPDLRGASRGLHARSDHPLRVRGRRRHRGVGDPDPGRALRLGLRGAGHRARAEQYPQVDGPRPRIAQRGAARRPAP